MAGDRNPPATFESTEDNKNINIDTPVLICHKHTMKIMVFVKD
jgi:hypothetical protein